MKPNELGATKKKLSGDTLNRVTETVPPAARDPTLTDVKRWTKTVNLDRMNLVSYFTTLTKGSLRGRVKPTLTLDLDLDSTAAYNTDNKKRASRWGFKTLLGRYITVRED